VQQLKKLVTDQFPGCTQATVCVPTSYAVTRSSMHIIQAHTSVLTPRSQAQFSSPQSYVSVVILCFLLTFLPIRSCSYSLVFWMYTYISSVDSLYCIIFLMSCLILVFLSMYALCPKVFLLWKHNELGIKAENWLLAIWATSYCKFAHHAWHFTVTLGFTR
jgi:hypothetical protein